VPPDGEAGGGSDSDCTCTPTGDFACHVIITGCSTDAECESGWSCIDNHEGVCTSDSEGNADCEPADPARLCAPPYNDLVGGGIGRGVSEDGGDTSSPGSAGSDDDSAEADSEERTSGGCAVTTSRPSNSLALLFAAIAAALAGRRKNLRV
jgi:MYXO-CTERM domain-containing protein